MLIRKMIRDMKIHKAQFISIFLMSFLALFIYAGLGSETAGYKKQLKKYYDTTHFADIWLYSANFTYEDESKIEQLNEVEQAQLRLSSDVTIQLEKQPTMKVYFQRKNDVNQVYVVEGTPFDSNDGDGIWLDYEFAKKRELAVGDSLTFSASQIELTKEIKGLVYSPEYVYMTCANMLPDHYMSAFAYMSENALPEYMPKLHNEIILTLKNSEKTNFIQLEDKLYELLPENKETQSAGLSVFVSRENFTSDVVFNNEITERESMTTIFPIAFIAIVLLTIMTTMTRLVDNQRAQIGILKAVGFKKGRIMKHYLVYGAGLTFIGGMLGAITGPLILPPLFHEVMKTTFSLPVWKAAFPYDSILVIFACVLLATLITYAACLKILREVPASVLRPKAPKTAKLTPLERTDFWKRRSFMTQWNLRDIIRSKARSIMAVVGVAGCMGLLVCGFACIDLFNNLISRKYDDICKYQNKYTFAETATLEQKDNVKQLIDGEYVMTSAIELKYGTKKVTTELNVVDDISMIRYLDLSWKEMELPKEGICITKKIADQLGVNVGDQVRFHIYGDSHWAVETVTGLYRDPAEQTATISIDAFEKLGYTFHPTEILSLQEKQENLSGVTSIDNISDSRSAIESMLQTMYLLIGVLCIAAALLAIVVLYNLGVLSLSEKERELATLKVIGFQAGKLRKLLLFQNIWLTVLGLLPGFYFGKFILKTIMASMGSEFDLQMVFSLRSILISALFTMTISLMVNYVFSGKLKKIDMVSSLKGVE